MKEILLTDNDIDKPIRFVFQARRAEGRLYHVVLEGPIIGYNERPYDRVGDFELTIRIQPLIATATTIAELPNASE